MTNHETTRAKNAEGIDRRAFLEGGTALVAAGTSLQGLSGAHAQEAKDTAGPAKVGPLPTRKLGKTGVDVSVLNLGTWKSVGLDRILRYSWANGIRYIDTAKSYGSEPAIGRWLQAMPLSLIHI